ncbi:hypothetical protein IJI28_01050 [Candidatus Saccharibacteria bacterium]|nr:hypothetical protein [Candidatus Saccharibacteria bacterium]
MNIIIQDLVPAIIICFFVGFFLIIILICALVSVIQMAKDIRRIADSLEVLEFKSLKSDTREPQDGEVSL